MQTLPSGRGYKVSPKIEHTLVRANVTAIDALEWPAMKSMERCVCV